MYKYFDAQSKVTTVVYPSDLLDTFELVSCFLMLHCRITKAVVRPTVIVVPTSVLSVVNAAKDDKNDWAYYGVAAHFNGTAGCGRCYQISYLPYCGKYWADDKDGQICCKSGDVCSYGIPFDCYQSQVGHCCLDGTCDNCAQWTTNDPEYNTMCCPLFHEPDPNNPGACIGTD